MNIIKAIIIEDEDSGREMLENLLRDFCPQVELIDSLANIKDARISILKDKPDLVFMDIQMPHGSAFDLIRSMQNIDFDIIFTSAHGKYAIEAFRVAALDFLLKPIEPDKLIEAVSRVKTTNPEAMDGVVSNIREKTNNQSENLPIGFPILEGIEYINPADITRAEGEGNYTNIFLNSGKKLLLSKNIGHIENLLQNRGFNRIHNSHIINLRYIKRYVKEGNGYVILSDGSRVDISRRRKAEFLKQMNSI